MLLLVVAPFLVRLRRVRTSSSMTTLIGMCLGWGMGDALVQLHVELVDALVGEPTATGVRNVLNICLSSLFTLAAAILILGLDRIAHRLRARSALRLPSQALGVSCMVGWAHTARALITSGLTDASLTPALRHGLYARVLVLWALCLSTAFALLVTKFVACRRRLVGEASPADESAGARAAGWEGGGGELGSGGSGGEGSGEGSGEGNGEGSNGVQRSGFQRSGGGARSGGDEHEWDDGPSYPSYFDRAAELQGDEDDEELYELYSSAHASSAHAPSASHHDGSGGGRGAPAACLNTPVRAALSAARNGGRAAAGRPLHFPTPPVGSPRACHGGAWRSSLPDTPSPSPAAAFAFALPRSGGGGARWLRQTASPLPSRRLGRRLERRCLRPLLVQYLALLEGATAWVTGVAWADAIMAWTTLGDYPTAAVTLQDLCVSTVLTLTAMLWLALSGRRMGPLSRQLAFKGSREEVELFFLTNALTFVVGWSWVILARDLSTLTSTALSAELEITELPIRLLLAALTAFVCGPLVGIVAGCLWTART